MERTRFVEHRGQRILLFDYAGLADSAAALREIEAGKALVARQPPGSLLTLVCVAGARFDSEVIEALKDLAAHNKPYVRAGAVVGMSGVHRIVYEAVMMFSRRALRAYDDAEQAKDWLIAQAAPNS
jgi:hypothetical protein